MTIREYSTVIAADPEDIDAHFFRAYSYHQIGSHWQAIEDYEKVLELSPSSVAYTNRGDVYKDMGRYEQAIYDYHDAIRLDPGYAQAYNSLAIAEKALGRDAEWSEGQACSRDIKYCPAPTPMPTPTPTPAPPPKLHGMQLSVNGTVLDPGQAVFNLQYGLLVFNPAPDASGKYDQGSTITVTAFPTVAGSTVILGGVDLVSANTGTISVSGQSWSMTASIILPVAVAAPTPAPVPTPTPAPAPAPTPVPGAPFELYVGFVDSNQTAAVVKEDGSSFQAWASLSSEPPSAVVVSLASTDTGEATVSTTTLIFTTSNWNVRQVFTITGVDDNELDGDQGLYIVITGNFHNDPLEVTILNMDDDAARWHYNGDYNVGVSENGGHYVFEMWLRSEPVIDAVISITSGDTGEVTASPATLTFTSSNWNNGQWVTLHGVNDTELDGDTTTTVTITGVAGTGINNDDHSGGSETVSVVNVDDENSSPDAVDDIIDWNDYIADGQDIQTRGTGGITFTVGGNDTDADGHAINIVSATNGANGTVDITTGYPGCPPVCGRLSYTPDGTYPSLDTFTYTISDGYGGIDTATVSVTYNPS
jgi:hypothetical protein